jgi:hypothetical protein
MLTVSMFVDQDTQESIQMSCNAPIGSTAKELAGLLATMREAGWQERIAANERIILRGEVIKAERAARIAAAREEGKPLDEDSIKEEDAAIEAALIKQASEAAADRAATNGGAAC